MRNGWIVQGATLDAATLTQQVETWNRYGAAQHNPDGVRGSHALSNLEVPERFVYVPADCPRGDPFNVGQMYALFAEAIHTGQSRIPTFDMAVERHRFIDTIQQASDTGQEVPVA